MLLRPLVTIALLSLGSAFTILPAQAETVPTTIVKFADLDLAKPADAKILAARLQTAAKSVCILHNPGASGLVIQRDCIGTSVSIAMSQLETGLAYSARAKLAGVRTAMAD